MDLDDDILDIIGSYVKQDNLERIQKEKAFKDLDEALKKDDKENQEFIDNEFENERLSSVYNRKCKRKDIEHKYKDFFKSDIKYLVFIHLFIMVFLRDAIAEYIKTRNLLYIKKVGCFRFYF